MPDDAVLRLRGISKRFGRLAVLRNVELDLEAGTIVGLIGANGAGKTTLLSIVAGLLEASSGSREFLDHKDTAVDLYERAKLALVTHTAQVYGRLTALENLDFFGDLRRSAGLPAKASMPLLDRLGLGYAAKRMAGTFSRGMLQRLALARAMVGEPALLLLDEPFTSLDRPGRALLADVLLEERDRGAAVLLSSHDFDAIHAVTDRTLLLEGGTVAAQATRGTDLELYRSEVIELAGRMPQLRKGGDTKAEEAQVHA